MNGDTFSASDWQAELDEAIRVQSSDTGPSRLFSPPPEQAYYIVAAREAGVQWRCIVKYCKSRGWGGSEKTMNRFYQQKKGK
jgi:hypothetical protein